jgi:hypothetical protein
MKRILAAALSAATGGAAIAGGWPHYVAPRQAWSIAYPPGAHVDTAYVNETTGPDHPIRGVAFRVPQRFTRGTNLGDDSALSVEHLPGINCKPSQFVDPAEDARVIGADGRRYRTAHSDDAGAGNRYETTIFVVDGTCTAVRYFLHYSAIENYDPDTVKAFDRKAVLAQFDRMRASLKMAR